MRKLKIHKTLAVLTLVVGLAMLVISCGPTYVRGDYGYRRPYYNYPPPRPYRYAVPPPPRVVVVPRYSHPPRSYRGRGYGRRG
jgi:hypothetical protein